jgi:malate dehydrogenase
VRCEGGGYEIVQDLEVGEFAQAKLDATVKELADERAAVSALGLL